MTEYTYPTPSDATLAAKAKHFLWTCKRRQYLQAKREGELDEWIDLKVRSCKRYAENLMASGSWAGEAWNRAIRLEILESETD